MNIPRVTVVMPVYNGEKYLREAIDSILGQTFQNFEFVIVNDGSTDNSESIILSYNDPRIVYLKNKSNSGICITLNRGLDVAKGEYIARMDCDDISMPNRLQEQLHFMDKHPEIAVAGTDIIVFGERVPERIVDMLRTPALCKMGLIFNSCCAHPSVMIRKSVLAEYHLRYKDEYKGREDFELWWQISKVSGITNIHKPLLKYRKHLAQITQNYDENSLKKARLFLEVRMQDIGVNLSSDQTTLLHYYCSSRFTLFTKEKLCDFIDVCMIIYESYRVKDKYEKYALRRTLSLAILFIVSNAGLHSIQWNVVKMIRKKGLLPLKMYLKLLFCHHKEK